MPTIKIAVINASTVLKDADVGKAVPALHRCAEMGRMHVHRGELPFADLPRF